LIAAFCAEQDAAASPSSIHNIIIVQICIFCITEGGLLLSSQTHLRSNKNSCLYFLLSLKNDGEEAEEEDEGRMLHNSIPIFINLFSFLFFFHFFLSVQSELKHKRLQTHTHTHNCKVDMNLWIELWIYLDYQWFIIIYFRLGNRSTAILASLLLLLGYRYVSFLLGKLNVTSLEWNWKGTLS